MYPSIRQDADAEAVDCLIGWGAPLASGVEDRIFAALKLLLTR
jgi:hypothetical protein